MSALPTARPTGPFNEILVHIPPDESADAVIASAVSMARLFAAHIDGVIAVDRSDSRRHGAYETGPSPLEIVAAFEDTMKAAARTLLRFEMAAQEAGISYGKRVISNPAEIIDQMLLYISRLYDLSIVAQPQRSVSAGPFPKAMLFDSGRPVILIPRTHAGGIVLDHITICWDGGRCAARAVHDAMPLLENARSIDIIAVNEGSEFFEPSSDALASHLTRRRLNIQVKRPKAEHIDIHRTIMAVATEARSRLVVMGGYGHSKEGRFVLGGVTRNALHAMSIPTFMSF
jgi:nucleotide-binding universal stress UspA family protein